MSQSAATGTVVSRSQSSSRRVTVQDWKVHGGRLLWQASRRTKVSGSFVDARLGLGDAFSSLAEGLLVRAVTEEQKNDL